MLTEIISKTAGQFYELVALLKTLPSKQDIVLFGKKKLILVNLFLISNDIYIFYEIKRYMALLRKCHAVGPSLLEFPLKVEIKSDHFCFSSFFFFHE